MSFSLNRLFSGRLFLKVLKNGYVVATYIQMLSLSPSNPADVQGAIGKRGTTHTQAAIGITP